MVNAAVTSGPDEAERALALSYAPIAARPGLDALFALDARLATIVRAAREPIVGQIRLTWWYEALIALDSAPPPAEPILGALHRHVLPHGVTGAQLAATIDAWELLLDPEPLDDDAMAAYADARGGAAFAAAAAVCGASSHPVRRAGEGWALADLARHLADAGEAARARAMAAARLSDAFQTRWPRSVRALGSLALLARYDVMASPPPKAGPRRVLRLMRHRWNGT